MKYLVIALMALTLVGCHEKLVTAPTTVMNVQFRADKLTIVAGESTFLRWTVSDVNATVRIDTDTGFPSTGVMLVAPEKTTKYILTATNINGSVTQSVTITVK